MCVYTRGIDTKVCIYIYIYIYKPPFVCLFYFVLFCTCCCCCCCVVVVIVVVVIIMIVVVVNVLVIVVIIIIISSVTIQIRDSKDTVRVYGWKFFQECLASGSSNDSKDTVRVYGWKLFQECLASGSSNDISCPFGREGYTYETSWSRSERSSTTQFAQNINYFGEDVHAERCGRLIIFVFVVMALVP